MKKLMSLTKLIFLSNNVYDTTFENLYCAFFFGQVSNHGHEVYCLLFYVSYVCAT